MNKEKNNLYPIFLKTNEINMLIVGGGNVALEKLTFLLKSSPNSSVEMVAPFYRPKTLELARKYGVKTKIARYSKKDLKNKYVVIATTNQVKVNLKVYKNCKKKKILVNVADNPPYCDFYMGGIVTKGNIKLAISTNGKSPTMAKRLRQFFEDVIPEQIDDLAINLNKYRKTLSGDFMSKVNTLNKVTEELLKK